MKGLEFLERIRKTESVFEGLVKMDPTAERPQPVEPEQHIDEAFKAKHFSSMGNEGAYNAFIKTPESRNGVHMSIDINDFKRAFNDPLGWEKGTEALKIFGNALDKIVGKQVGRKARIFHLGGDNFHVFVPSLKHAARVAGAFRQHLEILPPFKGESQLSASIGFGNTPARAHAALHNFAKAAKNASGLPPGRTKTHAHSLHEEHEGPIPVDNDHSDLMSAMYPKPEPDAH